ncbi:MAG: histidine--tRNA ligase, partial [Clostridiales bacterium]|nr:histidine--tRNA ligase [Clostridiales bacterium]
SAICDLNDRGLKAQMKYADKIGAKYSIVLGDDELAAHKAGIKNMKTGEKSLISLGDDFIEQFIVLQTKDEDDISF